MILAAGRGERMRPLSDHTPKPLLEVGGRPLIEMLVNRLAAAGLSRIVINLGWLGAQIRARLGDGSRFGVAIRYSVEDPEPLETAGGIFRALPLLDADAFAVVNGDICTDFPFDSLGVAPDADAHLILVPNPPHHPQGDFGLDGDRALPAAPLQYTFSGIAVYRPDFFAGCRDGKFPLKPLLLRSMTEGRCRAELFAGRWEDVGTPARLAALNAGSGLGDGLQSQNE
jgi:MurNAc alpha-1-phosphate uridylyltransferase